MENENKTKESIVNRLKALKEKYRNSGSLRRLRIQVTMIYLKDRGFITQAQYEDFFK